MGPRKLWTTAMNGQCWLVRSCLENKAPILQPAIFKRDFQGFVSQWLFPMWQQVVSGSWRVEKLLVEVDVICDITSWDQSGAGISDNAGWFIFSSFNCLFPPNGFAMCFCLHYTITEVTAVTFVGPQWLLYSQTWLIHTFISKKNFVRILFCRCIPHGAGVYVWTIYGLIKHFWLY